MSTPIAPDFTLPFSELPSVPNISCVSAGNKIHRVEKRQFHWASINRKIMFQLHWILLPFESIHLRVCGLIKAARPCRDLWRDTFIEPINYVVTGVDEPFNAVHDAALRLPIQSRSRSSLNTCVPTFFSQWVHKLLETLLLRLSLNESLHL